MQAVKNPLKNICCFIYDFFFLCMCSCNHLDSFKSVCMVDLVYLSYFSSFVRLEEMCVAPPGQDCCRQSWFTSAKNVSMSQLTGLIVSQIIATLCVLRGWIWFGLGRGTYELYLKKKKKCINDISEVPETCSSMLLVSLKEPLCLIWSDWMCHGDHCNAFPISRHISCQNISFCMRSWCVQYDCTASVCRGGK